MLINRIYLLSILTFIFNEMGKARLDHKESLLISVPDQ